MGIEDHLGNNIITTTLEKVVNWSRRSSVWPLGFGLACCAIEMIVAASARYDLARFGSEVFRPSPRQADLMIVAGTVTKKMLPPIIRIYEQMSEPKWVIAMGACACSGGIFDTYAVVQGIDQYLPVDVYIPGCPPRPEALIYGIMKLQQKIDKEKLNRSVINI
ncbi:MAG: NADH-quinone oxidoreductase subunit B family protein [Pseudomonadota bacterium]